MTNKVYIFNKKNCQKFTFFVNWFICYSGFNHDGKGIVYFFYIKYFVQKI